VALFDDEERAVVGTLYAREGRERAFEAGADIVGRKVDALVRRIGEAAGWATAGGDVRGKVDELVRVGIEALEEGLAVERSEELPGPGALVLCCWRGGLRSRSVAALLLRLGCESVFVIEGGYKSWRAHARSVLDTWRAPPAFVLRGLTGVGKTLVLNEVERLRPGWTIDLEALAQHRSSILGMVGRRPATQKTFESRLALRVGEGFHGPVVFEGESRKIGDAILPSKVWAVLHGGVSLKLEAPIERRVDVLIADYLGRPENRSELRARLPFIEERVGPVKWKGKLVDLLDRQADRELAALLLEHYYDPLYRHSERERTCAASFDATDPATCARSLVEWIEAQANLGAS
jgi:tRNA 2-selenouridine synthase